MNFPADFVRLRNVNLFAGDAASLLDLLARSVKSQRGVAVRLVNLNSIANAEQSSDYAALLASDGVNVVDGVPVKWAVRLRRLGAVKGLRGPDLFRLGLRALQGPDCRHYFLGGSAQSLPMLLEYVRRNYPNINISGGFSPAYGSGRTVDHTEYEADLRAAAPTIVWVGLGGVKQDFEAARLADSYGLTAIGVGAAFDFVIGHQKEAPLILRSSGLEWAYRLLTNPRRMVRRYTLGGLHAARWLVRR